MNARRRYVHSVAQLEGGGGLSIQRSASAPRPSCGWVLHPTAETAGFPPRPFSVKIVTFLPQKGVVTTYTTLYINLTRMNYGR